MLYLCNKKRAKRSKSVLLNNIFIRKVIGLFVVLRLFRILYLTTGLTISKDVERSSAVSEYAIETKSLTKLYDRQKCADGVNLHIQKGRVYGLLGRNGAGKTTVMKMLLGLVKPAYGEVIIEGKSLRGHRKELLTNIGSLIEQPGFYPNLTAAENLRIFDSLRGSPDKSAIKNALDLVGLSYSDKKTFSRYSLGMKQRLGIALAVMRDPDILILDEPTNGLDPIGIAEVRVFIRNLCDNRGKTVLISGHILSEISMLADDIGIIDRGELLKECSLSELKEKNGGFIRFIVSDAARAAEILAGVFNENNFVITDVHTLRLNNSKLSTDKIIEAFVRNGIGISDAHAYEESLEDYFKKITGGESLA